MEVSVNNNSSSTATTVRPRPTSEVRLGIARAELLHGLVSLVGLGPDGKEWRLLLNEELCRPRVPSVGELVAITPPWSLVGGVLLGLTDIKLLPPPPVSGQMQLSREIRRVLLLLRLPLARSQQPGSSA